MSRSVIPWEMQDSLMSKPHLVSPLMQSGPDRSSEQSANEGKGAELPLKYFA